MKDQGAPQLKRGLFVLLAISAVSFWGSAHAQTITITGILTLPNPAPASGVSFSVKAEDVEELESNGSDPVSFVSGEISQPFSITVDENIGSQWRIDYECTANCDDYMDFGVYADALPDNTSLNYDGHGTLLPGGSSHSGITMSGREAKTISGTLNFPAGVPAPAGGIILHVNTHDKNRPIGGYYDHVGHAINIPGGSTSYP